MISILILLSLTSSVLNETFNLENGKAKEIPKLSKDAKYYFLIKATEDQKLNIEMNMDCISNNPFSYIYI